MTNQLRWGLYVLAAVVGIAGAALGLSKGGTLSIIALVVIPIELAVRRQSG
ncbi:hypothetical protein U1701_06390 [Sphingomonas sp. PB2P19]|uniref:hypothetical protein n=1 Tax=Sphingomonas rhamnosi TaxID=3096156 RepID=UPI002FCBEE0D